MAGRRNDYPSDIPSLFDYYRRLDPLTQLWLAGLLLVLVVGCAFAYVRFHPHLAPRGQETSVQMLLGNPSSATPEPSDRDNFLMVRPYFALSYDDATELPNWVSWRVTESDLGSAPRPPEFSPDTALPAGFHQVVQHDYDGSGFDRGHMCPAADRNASGETIAATFVLSNVIPQAPNVNREAWEHLESYCRTLVKQHHDHLYITAGPAGHGGRGSKGARETLANGRVTVPAECWKIVVVVPDLPGDDDLAKIDASTRVIAVLMPNDQDQVGEDWSRFRRTPAQIEADTGLHFFSNLRPDLANTLRQKLDAESISSSHHYSHN